MQWFAYHLTRPGVLEWSAVVEIAKMHSRAILHGLTMQWFAYHLTRPGVLEWSIVVEIAKMHSRLSNPAWAYNAVVRIALD